MAVSRARRAGAVTVGGLVVALLCGLTTPPAAATPTPVAGSTASVARAAAGAAVTASVVSPPAGRSIRVGPRGRVGSFSQQLLSGSSRAQQPDVAALAVACAADPTARAGGSVTLTCSFPRVDAGSATRRLTDTTGPGARVRGLAVRFADTTGLRVRAVRGKGWSCPSGRAVRCRRDTAPRASGGGVLRVTATARRPATRTVRAVLTWRQADRDRWRNRRAAGTARVRVLPAATVSARPVGGRQVPVLAGAPADRRTVTLRAGLRGVGAGTPARVTWRQVSGPAARLLPGPAATTASTEQDSGVVLPAVRRRDRACFTATVTAGGVRDRDRTCLTLIPQRRLRVAPRARKLGAIVRAGRPPVAAPTGAWRSTPVKDLAVRLSGGPVLEVAQGDTAAVRARVPGQRVDRVAWRVVTGPRALLGTTSGMRTRLTPGRTTATGPAVIRADVTLAGGRRLSREKIVIITPARAVTGGVRAAGTGAAAVAEETALPFDGYGVAALAEDAQRVRAAASPDVTAARVRGTDPGGEAFCRLVAQLREEDAQIRLSDGTSLTVPRQPTLAPDCAAVTRLTLAGARIERGDLVLKQVSGSITREQGLRLTDGALALPDDWGAAVTSWGKDLPAPLAASLDQWRKAVTLPLSVPDGTFVGARIDERGRWGGLGGGTRVPSLSVLPLPQGWEWEKTAELSFEPKTGLLTFEQRERSGHLVVTGRISPLGQLLLKVTVANLTLVSNERGTLVGAGSGSISITRDSDFGGKDDGGEPALRTEFGADVAVAVRGTGSGAGAEGFELFEGLRLRNAEVAWGSSGIRVAGGVRIVTGGGGDGVSLDLAGQYTDTDNWSLRVATTSPWRVTDTVTVPGLAGSLARRSKDGKSSYLASLKGAVAGWQPGRGIRVDRVDGEVTNACPTDREVARHWFGKRACQEGEIRLQVSAQATITAPDGSPRTIAVGGWFNLATGKFRAIGSAGGDLFRLADGIVLRRITVIATNEGSAGVCGPTTGPGSLAFEAEGTVDGRSVAFAGQYDGDRDYCLIGRMTGDLPVPGGAGRAVDDLVVGYSSYATTAVVDGRTIPLPSETIALAGRFALPAAVTERIGSAAGTTGAEFAGTVAVTGSLTLAQGRTGFTLDGRYTLPQPVRLIGDAGGTHLELKEARLRLGVSGTAVSLAIGGSADFVTPLAGGVSRTPLVASLTVALGSTPSVSFSTGIDPTAPPVTDAFGQRGLTIRRLNVSFEFGATATVTVGAAASLPKQWTNSIVVSENAAISVDFQFSTGSSPCIALALVGGNDGSDVALDVAGKGIVTAREARFVYAPRACRYTDAAGTPQSIAAGYRLAFTGAVLGTPVTLDASLTPPTQNDSNFTLAAKADIGSFRVGPATLDQTKADILVDTRTATSRFQFSGGLTLNLGEGNPNRVAVTLAYAQSGANISVAGAADADLKFGPLTAKCGEPGNPARRGVTVNLVSTGAVVKTFGVSLDCAMQALGLRLELKGAVGYDNGALTHLLMRAGVSLDFAIARVSGHVSVEYRRPNYLKVGLGGSYWVPLLGEKSFEMTLVETGEKPADGTAVYHPEPPVSSTGAPPYRWLATKPGCLTTASFAGPSTGSGTGSIRSGSGPLRCADGQVSVRRPDSSVGVRNVWVTDCRVGDESCRSTITDRVDWSPTQGNPNPAPTTERSLVLPSGARYRTVGLSTYGNDHPYGTAGMRTRHLAADGSPMSSDGYRIDVDRWLPCEPLGPRETAARPCDFTAGLVPDSRRSETQVLTNYLIRTSAAAREELSYPARRQLPGTALTLDPDRRTPTTGDPGALLSRWFLRNGKAYLTVDRGDLFTRNTPGDFTWSSGSGKHVPRTVAAVLDDDCRIKLVDDTGITRLESRNIRRFGGPCSWSLGRGESAPFTTITSAVRAGDQPQTLWECGNGNQWGLRDGRGDWEKDSKTCRAIDDANAEIDPTRHPDWFIDNGR